MLDPLVQSVVLGMLQGLTEFLPISSSAHLILLPWMMGWVPLGILFDVMIHGGTLLAVLIYFRKDWKALSLELFRRLRERRLTGGSHSLLDTLIVGTIPSILVALALRGPIEVYARRPLVTVVTLSFFGLLLLAADRRAGSRALSILTLRDGLIIGVAQSLALVPGVSRSGITITAALLLGYSRSESARFSFLLAGPIIALGALDGLRELVVGSGAGGPTLGPLVLGVVTAFLVGFVCIAFLLRHLRTRSFLPFVIYRLALAGVILLLSLWGGGTGSALG